MSQTKNWEIVAFASEGASSTPQTIKRLKDGVEFSLGDYITNGTKMKGHIEKFEFDFKNEGLFIYTDWSGVGMNLESVSHTTKLPSQFQVGHRVMLDFGKVGEIYNCEVIKVHFTESKVLYDVEVHLNGRMGIVGPSTRLYNIDSCFVFKDKKNLNAVLNAK